MSLLIFSILFEGWVLFEVNNHKCNNVQPCWVLIGQDFLYWAAKIQTREDPARKRRKDSTITVVPTHCGSPSLYLNSCKLDLYVTTFDVFYYFDAKIKFSRMVVYVKFNFLKVMNIYYPLWTVSILGFKFKWAISH